MAALTMMVAIPEVALATRTEKTPPTTAPAVPLNGSENMVLVANCVGCVGQWGLWDLGSNIRAMRKSLASEIVNRIHVHGSIIKAFQDSCAGDWRFGVQVENFLKEQFNTSNSQTHDKQYAQGSQHAWGNVGAHEWDEDGLFWGVGQNGQADLCSTF
ncbi:MAG: hypothetical protein ACR2NT_03780 [Acidimicrobiia bacterium]